MWRLIYPLRYFRLINAEKSHLDLWATMVLALLIAVPFIALADTSFFHKDGFLDKLLALTSALTGFYVAALVAAATFTHPDLDKVIRSGPIALVTKDADGKKIREHLTRREFACTIFGYLAFASLFISLFAAIFVGLSEFNRSAAAKIPVVGVLLSGEYANYTRAVVIICFAVAIGHLVVATSLGLYYLMDRLYRRDREIVTPKIPVGSAKPDEAA